MNAINQIIIEGNVVRAPTLKVASTGKKVTTLPLAVNYTWKDSSGNYVNDVSYISVETWGERFAEAISKYGIQGRGVRVVGRLKQDRWKDKDGKNHERFLIIGEHVDFKPVKKSSADTTQTEAPAVSVSADEQNLAEAAAGVMQEAVTEAVF